MQHPIQTAAWRRFQEQRGLRTVEFNNGFMQIKSMPKPLKDIGFVYRAIIDSESITQLKGQAKDLGLSHIHIEPEQGSVAFIGINSESLFLSHTVIIDLGVGIEQIMSEMDKNTRYNCKYGRKNGVVTDIGTSDYHYKEFEKLVFETIDRKKYFGRDKTYYRSLWKEMKADGNAVIALAKHEDQVLTARMLFINDGIIYTPYTGNSAEKRNLKATNTIVLDIIEWGIQEGLTALNLWGIDYKGENKDHEGFSKFKLGFGGRVVEYPPAKDVVINEFSYLLFKSANWVRLLLREVKRAFK